MNMSEMTKTDLIEKIVKLGGEKPNAKTPKSKLVEMAQALHEPAKRKGSAKTSLRALFEKRGAVTVGDMEKISAELGVKLNTVQTALIDLKSPKWCGEGGPIAYQKDDKGRYVAA